MTAPMMDLSMRMTTYASAFVRHLSQIGNVHLLTGMKGNLGDHLIWTGTEQLLAAQGVDVTTLEAADLGADARAGCLVVPGSGAFTRRFHEWLPHTVERAAAIFDEVIIAPSEFHPDVPVVHRALSLPNVVAMARDAHSYRAITRFGRADLGLDLALHHPDFDPSLKPKYDGDGPTLVAMRTDHGSALHDHGLAVHPHANRDIAVEADTLDHYLDVIRGAANIVTDRLHVVVAAVMTGTRVTFVDPNDRKISRYVSFTFRDQADHLVQHVSFATLLEQGFVVPAGAS